MLSAESIKKLERQGYNSEEVEAVERWVQWCAVRITSHPAHKDGLVKALRYFEAFVQGEWRHMKRDPDHLPVFSLNELGGRLPVTYTTLDQEQFMMLSADVLLAGADGPYVTSIWMEETLDRLAAE